MFMGDVNADVLRGVARLRNADNVAEGDGYTIARLFATTVLVESRYRK